MSVARLTDSAMSTASGASTTSMRGDRSGAAQLGADGRLGSHQQDPQAELAGRPPPPPPPPRAARGHRPLHPRRPGRAARGAGLLRPSSTLHRPACPCSSRNWGQTRCESFGSWQFGQVARPGGGQVIVRAALAGAGLRVTSLGIRHRFSSFEQSRARHGGRGPRLVRRGETLRRCSRRPSLRFEQPRRATADSSTTGGQPHSVRLRFAPQVGQSPRQSSRHRRRSGAARKSCSRIDLSQVQPVALVVGDDHVAVGQLDLRLPLPPGRPGAAGRRGRAPARAPAGRRSRHRPHCRPSSATRRPRTWTVSSSPSLDVRAEASALEGEAVLSLEMDLARVEGGVDLLSLGRDLGDVDDKAEAEHDQGALKRSILAVSPDLSSTSGRTARSELAQERRAGRQGRQPEVLGERRAQVGEGGPQRRAPCPAAPAAPQTSRGTFSRVWSVETSEGSQPWSAVSRKTSSVAAARPGRSGRRASSALQVARRSPGRRCGGRRACRSRRGS